ncbi:MAG: energy transducer TonB [Pseudoxanthomonas sp.]
MILHRTRPVASLLASSFAAAVLLSACGGQPEAPPQPVKPPTELLAVDTPPPPYPMELACRNVVGTANLQVTIGVEGTPTEIKLLSGSGNDQLDKLAADQVKVWKFRAPTRNGQPYPKTIQVPIKFSAPLERPAECFQYDKK